MNADTNTCTCMHTHIKIKVKSFGRGSHKNFENPMFNRKSLFNVGFQQSCFICIDHEQQHQFMKFSHKNHAIFCLKRHIPYRSQCLSHAVNKIICYMRLTNPFKLILINESITSHWWLGLQTASNSKPQASNPKPKSTLEQQDISLINSNTKIFSSYTFKVY